MSKKISNLRKILNKSENPINLLNKVVNNPSFKGLSKKNDISPRKPNIRFKKNTRLLTTLPSTIIVKIEVA